MSKGETWRAVMGEWERYVKYLMRDEAQGFALDISRMRFPESLFDDMGPAIDAAFAAMRDLEAGEIANPDEDRMVGHYWLRTPAMAPKPALYQEIRETQEAITAFAKAVHTGAIAPERSARFTNLLLVGIGGSALGPQLISDALGHDLQPMRIHFLDNTDPDGMERTFAEIGARLPETLTVVASKSGGTKETRNGMLEAESRYRAAGLDFGKHAAAITGVGSELDRHAELQGWIQRFPMWDWVGGRTSVMSAVGLLPAALSGFDTAGLLRGAAEMDVWTRTPDARRNPAALLALMWHHAGGGHGEKDMVVLPYRDRLGLMAKYLQQLVMESLGKELDLQGRVVNQGIVVYGNKGSTDQHAYVQQLREGANNFFATFIKVLNDGEGGEIEVQPGVRSGDYLQGFFLGTRTALAEKDRESMTITLERLDAAALGRLIALFERAVGLYASLIGINAYHQPGVEAGKKAAEKVIALQAKALAAVSNTPATAAEIAASAGEPGATETVYHVLRRLSSNPSRGIKREVGATPAEDRFLTA